MSYDAVFDCALHGQLNHSEILLINKVKKNYLTQTLLRKEDFEAIRHYLPMPSCNSIFHCIC